jgi:hypothetical protein
MKFFHKKFLNQENQFEGNSKDLTTESKPKLGYLLNQLLIWGSIFIVLFFIFKFMTIYSN